MKFHFLSIWALVLILSGCADKVDDEDKLVECGDGFCTDSQGCCNGVCVDLTSSLDNCGRCGNSCGNGICRNSECYCGDNPTPNPCGAGTVCCKDSCTNLSVDKNNCGICGNACPTQSNAALHYSPANAPNECVQGVCQLVCDNGYKNIDNNPANGCECGNGVIDGNEQCDRNNLNQETCGSLGYTSATGALKCTDDCTFDVSGCGGGAPIVSKCEVGTYKCEGNALYECKIGDWTLRETCSATAICDKDRHVCVCPAGMSCNKVLDFDTFPSLPDYVSSSSGYTGSMNQATVQIVGTVMSGVNAISGNKSIAFGVDNNDGQIKVSDIQNGVGKVTFDVKVVDDRGAMVKLLYELSGDDPNSVKTLTKTDTVVSLEFIVNKPINIFTIRSEGLIIVDNLLWTNMN